MLKLKKLKASKLSKSRRSGHADAPLPVTKTRNPFLAEFSEWTSNHWRRSRDYPRKDPRIRECLGIREGRSNIDQPHHATNPGLSSPGLVGTLRVWQFRSEIRYLLRAGPYVLSRQNEAAPSRSRAARTRNRGTPHEERNVALSSNPLLHRRQMQPSLV
jgi:hypothetical protein